MQRVTWIGVLSFGALAVAACSSSSGGGTPTGSGASSSATTGPGATTGTAGSTTTSANGGSTTTSANGGSTTTSANGGSTTTSANGGSTTTSANGGATGAGGSAPACSGSTPVALTVLNFDGWCSVTVAGGAASPLPSTTTCVADGSVTLTATPNPTSEFQLGNWFGTAGDMGTGDPGNVSGGVEGTSTASVTITGSTTQCVSVCCPFIGGTGCAATDACP